MRDAGRNNVRTRFEYLALGVALLGGLARGDEPPLRYGLRVGDWLTYERRALVVSLADRQQRWETFDRIQVRCLTEREGDLLVLLDSTRLVSGQAGPLRGLLVYLDSRGQRRWPPGMKTRIGPLETLLDVVPPLRPAAEPRATWRGPPDVYGRRWRCTRIGADERRRGTIKCEYEVEDPTGVSEIMGQTHSGRFWLDPEGQVVTRIEARVVDEQSAQQTDVVTTLRQRARLDEGWCSRRTTETPRYLCVLQSEDRLRDELVRQSERAEQVFRGLERVWSAFRADLEPNANSPFAALGQTRRQALPHEEVALRAQARYAAYWLGRVAQAWSLQDVAGQSCNSEALRGKVTIEYLWSSESVWGLRGLQVLRRLQDELAGAAVNVVALNLDQDSLRGQRAAKRCGYGLTVVLAGPLQSIEAPPEYPVLRVLDSTGVVRRVVLGWRWSYADVVKPMLAER
ncbi:MAG: hypothetical protein KKB50_01720 [Planctomycetes bacterium]|nr:hypothetical protein [Planctomycetota bacterium]